MSTERSFQSELVLSAISNGAFSLGEISRASGGMYPGELLEVLDELVRRQQVISFNGTYELTSISRMGSELDKPGKSTERCQIPLPEPHPHDYDWRFTRFSTEFLVSLARKECRRGGRILLLGTPSLFTELARSSSAPPTTLLDNNHQLLDFVRRYSPPGRFSLVHHDLLSGHLWSCNHPMQVVLCDPPWYPEFYSAFLAQASHSTAVGGSCIIALLPINVRPNAASDRWQIFSIAEQLGFHLETVIPNAVQYQTPSFEIESLCSAQLDVMSDWRIGDLAVFLKVAPAKTGVIEDLVREAALHRDDQVWADVLLGKHKIKLRGPFNDPNVVPKLISIEPNDILPTVSRRYPGRDKIDLWLWDNRVFAVRGKAAILTALLAQAGQPIPQHLSAVCSTNRDIAVRLLDRVIGPGTGHRIAGDDEF